MFGISREIVTASVIVRTWSRMPVTMMKSSPQSHTTVEPTSCAICSSVNSSPLVASCSVPEIPDSSTPSNFENALPSPADVILTYVTASAVHMPVVWEYDLS